MRLSNKSLANLNKALAKQSAPGPAPRPGLEWKPSTHRWIRPTGDNEITEDEVREYVNHPSFDYVLGQFDDETGVVTGHNSGKTHGRKDEGHDIDAQGQASSPATNVNLEHVLESLHPEDAARYLKDLQAFHHKASTDPNYGGEEGTEMPDQHPEDHPLHAKIKAHEETNRDGWTKAMGALNFDDGDGEGNHSPIDRAGDLITDGEDGAYGSSETSEIAEKLMSHMYLNEDIDEMEDEHHPLERHAGKDKDITRMAEELGGIDPVVLAAWFNANNETQGMGGHFGHGSSSRDSGIRYSIPT